jgi:hypothetical protein
LTGDYGSQNVSQGKILLLLTGDYGSQDVSQAKI